MAAYRAHFFSKIGEGFRPNIAIKNPSNGFTGEVAELEIGEFSFPLTRSMADDLIYQTKRLEIDLLEKDQAKLKAIKKAQVVPANGHDAADLEGKDALLADL
jgi:hypothetical protein